MPRRFLPALLCVVLVAAADKGEQKPSVTLSNDEKTILELTNKARAEKNLPALTVDSVLTAVARAHSANMAKKGEMNHVLDGKNPADRVKEAGYHYSWTGENIAMGENVTVPDIFEGWMKSKAHRDNILKPEYQEIGIGIARNDKGEVYYAQEFGTKMKD
jgi:uncharacterized protein YkwD